MERGPYRVLLVDDEPSFLKMMAKVLPWRDLGCEVVGLCPDGVDALAKIREVQPHIVITDIKMPEMDGLELIRTCFEEMSAEVAFIIVSGYDDFQYARKAIYFNVRNYLLKPLDVSELRVQIEKLVAGFDMEARIRSRNAFLDRSYRQEAFRRFVKGEQAADEMDDLHEKVEDIAKGGCRCVVFTLGESMQEEPETAEMILFEKRQMVMGALTDLLGAKQELFAFFDDEDRIMALLPDPLPGREGEDLSDILIKLRESLEYKWQIACTLLVGNPVSEVRQIARQFKIMRNTMNSNGSGSLEPVVAREGAGSQDAALARVGAGGQELAAAREGAGSQEPTFAREGAETIDRVLAYVDLHFRESVSLRSLAKVFFLNATYLGQLFKNRTDEYFIDYLQRKRIEEARRLLTTTDEKVETIGRMVGYRDKNYFSAIFSMLVEMPPSQYRLSQDARTDKLHPPGGPAAKE